MSTAAVPTEGGSSGQEAVVPDPMRIELAAEAVEFGAQAVRALGAAGGDDLVRAAEADPYCRHDLVSPVLGRLGGWDLAPRRDPVELEAAAALCRACGYWATPYPVAERLARPVDPVGAVPTGSTVDGVIVVSGPEPAAALAGLDLRFLAVTPGGGRGIVRLRDSALGHVLASGRATAFVVPVEFQGVIDDESRSNGAGHSRSAGTIGGVSGFGYSWNAENADDTGGLDHPGAAIHTDGAGNSIGTGYPGSAGSARDARGSGDPFQGTSGDRQNGTVRPSGADGPSGALSAAEATREDSADADLALVLTLQSWTLLGMLDRAMELAKAHVLVREQFGRPLAEFQAVQFQLTDAEVERKGVEMLARYAVWSIQSGRSDAVADALALRLAALEAADIVFRVAHQLHGALGFCDESPLSWLSRHSLPLRRLPMGGGGTEQWLALRVGTRGLTGLFSEPGER